MRSLDEVFDIYQSFLDSIELGSKPNDFVRVDDSGNERALLAFPIGFNVELTNQRDVENSVNLRC